MAATAAAPPAAECMDLNIAKTLAADSTVVDALSELVANAFDAHLAAGVPGPPKISSDGTAIMVSDNGKGLARSAVIVGVKVTRPGRIGAFGLGLKDALAVLFSAGANIDITSAHGKFTISERPSKLDASSMTLHILHHPAIAPPPTGTTIKITGLPADKLAAHVMATQARFLALQVPKTPLVKMDTAIGTVEVYPRTSATLDGKKNHMYLYVNNAKQTSEVGLYLLYNIISNTAKTLFTRDHIAHSLQQVQEEIAEAACKPEHQAKIQTALQNEKARCEFKFGKMEATYYPHKAAKKAAKAAKAQYGGGASSTPAAASPVVAVAAPPVRPAPAHPDVVALYDYENAHNAWPAMRDWAREPSHYLYVFAQEKDEAVFHEPGRNIALVWASATAQAADTRLCFKAGQLAESTPARTELLIVSGNDARYPELVTALKPKAATLLVFDSSKEDGGSLFTAGLKRAIATAPAAGH
jgi:hypothetical protein